MSNNAVKDWSEFSKLQELPVLEDLLFVGNPLEETHTASGEWRKQVANRLKGLKKLDGIFLTYFSCIEKNLFKQFTFLKRRSSYSRRRRRRRSLNLRFVNFCCQILSWVL